MRGTLSWLRKPVSDWWRSSNQEMIIGFPDWEIAFIDSVIIPFRQACLVFHTLSVWIDVPDFFRNENINTRLQKYQSALICN